MLAFAVMVVDAIVPAHNEEPTVGSVVKALRDSGAFRRVLVVDDGSTDSTSFVARAAGAEVLRLNPNRGKGGAMLAAYQAIKPGKPDRVSFFDADLLTFKPAHAQQLVALASCGYDMVCGLRDYGPIGNYVQARFMPLITGERIIKPWILDRMPLDCWSGFRIEPAMNSVCEYHGGQIAMTLLHDLKYRTKGDKIGPAKAIGRNVDMLRQQAQASLAMAKSGCKTCGGAGSPSPT